MNPDAEPEISVLIPAYNSAPWLAETLSRLAAAVPLAAVGLAGLGRQGDTGNSYRFH